VGFRAYDIIIENLVWVDMENDRLHPETDVVLEIAL